MAKAIKNGKLYNTETATKIGTTRNWDGRNWSNRWTELYRTKKGNFFSVYFSQWQGEPWGDITPMSTEDAKLMYEGLNDSIDYAEAFGEEAEEA